MSEDRAVGHTLKSQVHSIGWVWSGPSEFSQTIAGRTVGIAWDRDDSQMGHVQVSTMGFSFLSFLFFFLWWV